MLYEVITNLDNILFIGSGNLVHNLYEVDFDDNARPFEWAKDINESYNFV